MADNGTISSGSNNLNLVRSWPSGIYSRTKFFPFKYPGPASRITPINIQENEIDVDPSSEINKRGIKEEEPGAPYRHKKRTKHITEYLVENLQRDLDYYREKGILHNIPQIENITNEPQVYITGNASLEVDAFFHQLFQNKVLHPVVFYMNGKGKFPNKLTITLYEKLRPSYSFFKIICHDLLEYTSQRFLDLFVISKNIKSESTSPLMLAINPNYTFLKLYILAEEDISEIIYTNFIVIGEVDVNRKFLDFQNPSNSTHKPVNILAVGFKEIIEINEEHERENNIPNPIANFTPSLLFLVSMVFGGLCLFFK